MHPLELKVPPPLVALIVAAAMWMNSISGPRLDLPFEIRVGIALAIAAAGAVLDILGLIEFRKAKTTINPLKPHKSAVLATSGVYSLSRNPMYLGLLCYLAAWAAYLSSLWPLAGPVLFVFYLNRFQIEPEERILAQRFGEDYKAYRARVRRWL